MGTRSLRGISYLTCDYAGNPIKCWSCYHQAKTMAKRNHFCNWEAAAADATRLLNRQLLSQAEYDEIIKNILVKASGVAPGPPPPIREVKYLFASGSIIYLQEFQEACCNAPYKVTVLKIS